MQVENHKEEVPLAFYIEKYAHLQPGDVAQRLGIALKDGTFSVHLLGTNYRIAYPKFAVTAEEKPEALQNLQAQTFLLRLLLEGKKAPVSSDFKTFRELPWGEVYIKPFTGRVLTRAAFSFGTKLDSFCNAAERVGGLPLRYGDAAFEFTLWDNYRLRLIVWEGDEEFAPNAQLLYSANFADGFAAEDRVVAGDLLIQVLKAAMD